MDDDLHLGNSSKTLIEEDEYYSFNGIQSQNKNKQTKHTLSSPAVGIFYKKKLGKSSKVIWKKDGQFDR